MTFRIIFIGKHIPSNWKEAIKPSNPIWTQLSEPVKIVHIRRKHYIIPPSFRFWKKTVVIPLWEPDIQRLSTFYRTLAPSKEAVRTLKNKRLFANYVAKHKLENHHPAIYSNLETAIFPCVLKRTDLCAGQGVEIASSAEQAYEILDKAPFKNKPYVIQSQIEFSEEYTLCCASKNGKILWHQNYRYQVDPIDPILRWIDTNKPPKPIPCSTIPESIEVLEKFIKPLSYCGPCNVDFVISDKSEVIIFEINPRFGGSLMLPENTNDFKSAIESIIEHAN